MKDVRVWFRKDGECRYISHLDLNRCMLRALHKSRIPIWHTEGFHVHPYATFPLPLSLGFRGEKECMDIRLIGDISFEEIKDGLNTSLPTGIKIYDVTKPEMKAKVISFASFKIRATSDELSADEVFGCFSELLQKDEILVEKKTKKKGVREVDIKPYLDKIRFERNIGGVLIYVTLPAGSVTNINPLLIQKAFERLYNSEVYFDVTKTDMFDSDMNSFK